MKKIKYASFLDSAIASKRDWRLIAMILVVANLFLVFRLLTIDTREKTIVTPVEFSRPFWVKGNEASPEYFEQVSKYFVNNLLNYTPATARAQFEQVLKYAAPENFGALKAQFDVEAQRIQRNSISSSFVPSSFRTLDSKSAVISGEVIGFVGMQLVNREVRHFAFEFDYRGGNFYVKTFKEVVPESNGDTYRESAPQDTENAASVTAVSAVTQQELQQ